MRYSILVERVFYQRRVTRVQGETMPLPNLEQDTDGPAPDEQCLRDRLNRIGQWAAGRGGTADIVTDGQDLLEVLSALDEARRLRHSTVRLIVKSGCLDFIGIERMIRRRKSAGTADDVTAHSR